MRRTIRKFFFVWDFDKEEKWLNEMAAKGLALVSTGFCKYEFEDSLPGEYKVCLQLLDKMPSHPESQKYIAFMEETGAEHVGSFTRWVFFRKKASEGDFQLFSDNDSKVKYMTSMLSFVALIVGLNLYIGLYNLFVVFFLHSAFNYIGLLNFAIALVGIPGVIKLWKKRNRMKKESQLFE
ncbi:MAG: DUF2812 domain-containing protein [Oscillospiraceae bacterium]|nr:DUF2812 domain-containing protein [Oscillospiraceae bacterium]